MKFTSLILAAASGSVGGLTYSHNKGGQYIRARAIPTNPNTTEQQSVKALMAFYSSNWQFLTQAERDDWGNYAAATPFTDSNGSEYFASGQNHYCRTNIFRVSAGLADQDAAPTTGGLALFTAPTSLSITGSTNIIGGNITDTDPWATASTGALVVSSSRQVSPGVGSSKQNLRIAGVVPGNTTVAPVTINVATAFNADAGNKMAVGLRVVDGEGRLSILQRFLLLIA